MAVFRLALLALCLWHAVDTSDIERKPWTPSTSCPEECTCSASSLTTMRIRPPQINRQMAQCSAIPKAAVASSIYSIKVNGEIDKVTPDMLAKLGRNLEELDLSNCGISHIVKGSFDKLGKLAVLKLSNNKIETIDTKLFKETTQLKKLFLNGNLIKEIGQGTFSKCTNLEELHLEMNQLREFPSKLPQKLTTLDLSHNDIMTLNAKDMDLILLKTLDLCYNHIETWMLSIFASLQKIQDLCLGMAEVVLPEHTAEKIPSIAHLKLISELTEPLHMLHHITQDEIGKMKRLTTLTIENYRIESLAFLLNHTNLKELRFVNVDVTTTNSVEMKQIFANNPYLTNINFNQSPNLADILVNNIYMVAHLQDLQRLSMQSSGIEHLPTSFEAPNTNFRLDISHNALHCDCQFEWLRQMDKASMHYLLACSENTTCHSPEIVQGKTLEDFVNTVDCSTGPTTEVPQVEEQDPTEMFSVAHHYDDTITDEVLDTDHVEGIDQTSEGEEAGKTDKKSENESDKNNEDHKTGENEQSGKTDVNDTGSRETDVVSEHAHVDSSGTDFQFENSEKGTEEEDSGDQEKNQEANDDGGGTGEHITTHDNTDDSKVTNKSGGSQSHHHKPRSGNEDHAKIYLVLGCLLLVLVFIGVILGVVYWKYKQDGKNKVEPGTEEPHNEPIEPTYKQTLASEDTTLIKK